MWCAHEGTAALASGVNSVWNVFAACRKGYHELNSGTLGVFIDPSRSQQVLIPYSAIPGIGTVLQACVTQVQHAHVTFFNRMRSCFLTLSRSFHDCV